MGPGRNDNTNHRVGVKLGTTGLRAVDLLGQFCGDRLLEAAQHEGAQHLVQPVSDQQGLLLIQHG